MTNHLHRTTYIGHATILIEMDGVRILTDPVLRPRVMHLINHNEQTDELAHPRCDLVLISHAHWDHLDLPSLRRIDRRTTVFAPMGVGKIIERSGFTTVHEMRPGEQRQLGALRISAMPADHDGKRYPFGEPLGCLGFIVEGRYSVYFPGDTDIFPAMSEMAGLVDVALLPVWGWGPTLGPGHMTPRRAAESLTLLKPKAAIPIHWGTFFPAGLRFFMPTYLVEPPQLFARYAQELAPETHICILRPGESVDLDEMAARQWGK